MPLPHLVVTARISPAVGSIYLADAITAVHRADGYPSAVIEAESLVTLDDVRSQITAALDATPRPSAVVLDLGRRWQEVIPLLSDEKSSSLFARVERCTVCVVTNAVQAANGYAVDMLTKLADTTVTTVGGAKPVQFVELVNSGRAGADMAFRLEKKHISATLSATSLTLPSSTWWQGSAEDLFHAALSTFSVFRTTIAPQTPFADQPPYRLKQHWIALRASAAVLADALAAADLAPYGFSRRLFPVIPNLEISVAGDTARDVPPLTPVGLSNSGAIPTDRHEHRCNAPTEETP